MEISPENFALKEYCNHVNFNFSFCVSFNLYHGLLIIIIRLKSSLSRSLSLSRSQIKLTTINVIEHKLRTKPCFINAVNSEGYYTLMAYNPFYSYSALIGLFFSGKVEQALRASTRISARKREKMNGERKC